MCLRTLLLAAAAIVHGNITLLIMKPMVLANFMKFKPLIWLHCVDCYRILGKMFIVHGNNEYGDT